MRVVSGAMGKERVHFEAPPCERLPDEMARFLDWLNSPPRTDLLIKAGMAHLWFVTLHPFDDGNGRIARAIADMRSASLRAFVCALAIIDHPPRAHAAHYELS